MNEQAKKKLCWNCEGSVAKHLETCPYCGVYLSPSEHDIEEELTSSMAPPFPSHALKSNASVPKPPYQSEPGEEVAEASNGAEAYYSQDSLLSPLLMFITGTSFGLFGLSLWLFSVKGHLTLSWNEDWAGVFILIALPLLFFGARSLYRLDEV